MLDPHTELAVSDMAASLHRTAVGRWFQENRAYVTAGICLSIVALFAVAQPRRQEQWGVLILAIAMMAPSAFYLFFLSMRAWDLCRSLRQKFDGTILRRAVLLLAFIVSCIAGIILGGVVLGGNFGWPLIAVALFLTILNVFQLQ